MAETHLKRITLEQVLEAYEKTGLAPVYGIFTNGLNCACPLTALYCATTGGKTLDAGLVLRTLQEEGYSCDYLQAFYRGVDDAWGGSHSDFWRNVGYADGRKVGYHFRKLQETKKEGNTKGLVLSALSKAESMIGALLSYHSQGLEVHGWHENGDSEPLDNFFDENRTGDELETLRKAIERLKSEWGE